MEKTDVVIVGSGPTGLMAAALLVRCGVKVRIFDKSDEQGKESRAFAVHARSMELFLSMGLCEEFLNRGLMASGAQIFVDGKQAAEVSKPRGGQFKDWICAISFSADGLWLAGADMAGAVQVWALSG